MSLIRADLHNYLKNESSVASLLTGTDGKVRIHFVRIPQSKAPANPYPCITYRRATGGHKHSLDGSMGFAEALFEIDVWGEDSIVAEQVGEAVRLVMQGFRGTWGSSDVRRVTLDDEQDFYYPSEVADDVGVYRLQYKYTIGHGETIPSFS